MWTCSKCNRKFKVNNQSHWCGTVSIDDLFYGKPDDLVLAFDTLLMTIEKWEPFAMGTSVKTIVFTNKKAWLILKPMTKEIDLKIYLSEPFDSPLVKRITDYKNKFAHHIRLQNEHQISKELLDLLKKGFDYAMN